MPALLEMHGIVKNYGPVRANRGIDFNVGERRVVGLLGENGSGKSTLMKILFGMVQPDSGEIVFEGRRLTKHSPRMALGAGIGMIHQHFTLVEAMTVTENVMLGWNHPNGIGLLKPAEIAAKIAEASHTYGLAVRPGDVIADLSFGQRQRVEIVKAILRGSKLLIFDEPTSNLSPSEVAGLLEVIRKLRDQGHSVVFISHKLNEVLEICDEVVVLRDGAVSGHVQVAGATRESLARMMVDRDLSAPVHRETMEPGEGLLRVEGLSRRGDAGGRALSDIHFTIRAGEVLAIAGIDGNGQRELLDVLSGVLRMDSGRIHLHGADITGMNVRQRLRAGLAYIPVDRAGTSLVPDFTIAENLAMRDIDRHPFAAGPFLKTGAMRESARTRMAAFDIRAHDPSVRAGTLSGGNQQKIVLAREIGRNPKVLLALQPTWGLDPGAARFVIDQILLLRDAGSAVVYISAELEEVLTLGDQIAVMFEGRLTLPQARGAVTATQIGMAMAGAA
ncbi:MAG: ABC transporter ATP-binding protein [Acidobacteriota bacterium]